MCAGTRAEPHARLPDARILDGVPAGSWTHNVPGVRRVPPAELPPGYTDALRLSVPVVRMPDYLPWLAGELAAAGVRFRTVELADLDPPRRAADLVVHATGLAPGSWSATGS